MDTSQGRNFEQATLWNSTGAQAWVEAQPIVERMFEPFTELLLEPLANRNARRVLDIGCGTGDTTLAAARRVGEKGNSVGIDISQPLVAAAQLRAARAGVPATFLRADAQTYAFEPASFDLLISRFGVMFFDDPIAAFANLRRAAASDAELRFIAWRTPAENPFMTTAERAAAPLLPSAPPRQADAPGQFAFADSRRVAGLLERGGWDDVETRPVDVVCTLPESELVRYFTRFGPLGRLLPNMDEEARKRIIATVRPAYDPFIHGAEVRFTAACWLVRARASASR